MSGGVSLGTFLKATLRSSRVFGGRGVSFRNVPKATPGARFPRSEPQASGAFANESHRNDRSHEPRFPRSEPKASGAIANESHRNDRSHEPRFPRSEPQASGEFHQARARIGTQLLEGTQ